MTPELISSPAGGDPAPVLVGNERVAAIVATLRQVAGWGDVPPEELVELADVVERQDWAAPRDDEGLDGLCCPMCQEVECDAGCPLEPERGRRKPCTAVPCPPFGEVTMTDVEVCTCNVADLSSWSTPVSADGCPVHDRYYLMHDHEWPVANGVARQRHVHHVVQEHPGNWTNRGHEGVDVVGWLELPWVKAAQTARAARAARGAGARPAADS